MFNINDVFIHANAHFKIIRIVKRYNNDCCIVTAKPLDENFIKLFESRNINIIINLLCNPIHNYEQLSIFDL